MALELYKPNEATKSRGGIAVAAGGLFLYGIVSLYEYLASDFWQGDVAQGLLGDEFPLSPRVFLCMLLILFTALSIYWTVNHPRVVEFLIATETEMTKVSWPPRHEVVSSSLVVIITVAVMAVYLGLVDSGILLFMNGPDWESVWDKIFGGGSA